MLVDSVDKIVSAYFAAVTAESFVYKDHTYRPRPLRVSPLIFRGYTCPAGCGGCCPRFSLDYLPGEAKPYDLKSRWVDFNGHRVKIWSDLQGDHNRHHCRNLRTDGRCGIHGKHPFSCDFELIRASISHVGNGNGLSQRLFGRGHSFLRVDDGRGALCEMTPPDGASVGEVVRKLERLRRWTNHFGLRTVLDDVIVWAKTGPHARPLFLNAEFNDSSPFSLPVLGVVK